MIGILYAEDAEGIQEFSGVFIDAVRREGNDQSKAAWTQRFVGLPAAGVDAKMNIEWARALRQQAAQLRKQSVGLQWTYKWLTFSFRQLRAKPAAAPFPGLDLCAARPGLRFRPQRECLVPVRKRVSR